jgi:hypothetical protein
MPHKHYPPALRHRARELHADGETYESIAKSLEVPEATIGRWCRGTRKTSKELRAHTSNPPKPWDKLTPLAQDCLGDSTLFAQTLFALRTPAWWRLAADEIVAMALSDEREFALFHAPVGAGKTTLLETVVMWLLAGGGSLDPARGRALRILFGAATMRKAIRSVDRIRGILDDPMPMRAYGPAEHSMSELYGRFKPDPSQGDDARSWRLDQIFVATLEDHRLSDRDPSLAAYSLDSRGGSALSARVDLAVVDDAALMRTVGDESLVERFNVEFESRIDPPKLLQDGKYLGGAMFVVGQRIAMADLYGSLAERTWADDAGEIHHFYKVLKYPAHRDEPPHNEHVEWNGETGCLLDRVRLPWRTLLMEQSKPTYSANFQQDPEAGGAGLIPQIWIDGGVQGNGPDRVEFGGCYDRDRAMGEYPVLSDDETEDLITYATVDPALSTGYWSIQIWATTRWNGPRWLIQGFRKSMPITDFLGIRNDVLTGMMRQLQIESRQRGKPIRVWVIEWNVFGSQFQGSQAFQLFERSHPDVHVIWQKTQKNKQDSKVGIEAKLPELFKAGRVRIPRRSGDIDALNFVKAFVKEHTSYPYGKTLDTVLGFWFGETNMQEILTKGSKVHEVPVIDIRMPRYLKERGERWDAKPPRPLPAGLGTYRGGQRVPVFDPLEVGRSAGAARSLSEEQRRGDGT